MKGEKADGGVGMANGKKLIANRAWLVADDQG